MNLIGCQSDLGLIQEKVQFSSLILTDQMTRDEALKKLKNLPYDKNNIKNDFEYIANKLSISVKELQGYMDMPKKTFRDYRSQESIYNFGAKNNEIVWNRAWWKKMIGIIDYGLGNIRAFSNIYKMLNVDYKIVQKKKN